MHCSMQCLRPQQCVPYSLLKYDNSRSLAKPVHLLRSFKLCKAADSPFGAVNLASQETVAPVEAEAADPQQHPLFAWVRQNNGYVHPALAIVHNAPCGCRGVIAVADVSMPAQQQHEASDSPAAAAQAGVAAKQQQLPLLAVPEQLYMTTDDALDILGTAIAHCQSQRQQHSHSSTSSAAADSGGLQALLARFNPLGIGRQQQQQQLVESLQRLQPPLLLALLLAYERSKGPDSSWHPYIANLPSEPPCGWFTALQQQQQQQQQQLPAGMTPDDVAAAAAAVVSKCSTAAALFAPALGDCFGAADVVWAYGQVVSRAFGAGRDVGFAPLIDMCNHQLGASQPQLLTVPGDAAAAAAADSPTEVTHATPLAAVTRASTCENGPLPLGHPDKAKESALSLWCVCKAPQQEDCQQQQQQQQQRQLVLAAGEELYISYVTRCDARSAYLNFGFVPPEGLREQ